MPSGHQSEAIAGGAKETTWGTAVQCTRYRPFVSESLMAKRTPITSKRRTGAGGGKKFLGVGPVEPSGSIVEELPYDAVTDAVDELLEQVFGVGRGHWYRRLALTGASVSWIPLRNGAADNEELADLVPVLANAASATITVRRRLKRIGTPSGGNNEIWVELQLLTTSLPNGTPIANATSVKLSALSVTTNPLGEEYEFTFAIDPSLAASPLFAIVLKGDYTASATNQIQMLVENVASGGTFAIKDASYAADTTKSGVGRGLTTSTIDSYIMAKSSYGLFSSYAIDKGISVHQFTGVKATGFTLSSKPKEGVTVSYDVLFHSQQDTATTTAAQLAALNVVPSLALHSDLTVLISDQADPLVAGDAVDQESTELKLMRPQDKKLASGSANIKQPREDGDRDCTLSFTVPRYEADTYKNWEKNKTALQAKLQFLSGGRYRSFLMPNGRVTGCVEIPTDGDKPYTQKITIQFYINEGANLFIPIQYEAEMYLGAA